jgi:hypothetical protein
VRDGIQSLSIIEEKISSHHNPTLILFTRSSDLWSKDFVLFVLCCMREELRVMEVNSEHSAARFNIDFDDRSVFDSYSDDLNDGPVFDTDAATIDTSSACLTKCPHAAVHTELARYVAATEFEFTKEHAVFDFEGVPLFDEDLVQTTVDYSIDKEFAFGSNITAMPTSEDRPSTCSMKC